MNRHTLSALAAILFVSSTILAEPPDKWETPPALKDNKDGTTTWEVKR